MTSGICSAPLICASRRCAPNLMPSSHRGSASSQAWSKPLQPRKIVCGGSGPLVSHTRCAICHRSMLFFGKFCVPFALPTCRWWMADRYRTRATKLKAVRQIIGASNLALSENTAENRKCHAPIFRLQAAPVLKSRVDSKSRGVTPVPVRFRPPAPAKSMTYALVFCQLSAYRRRIRW